MGVDMVMRVIDGDMERGVTAKSKSFIHRDTEHGDQNVQRHIIALKFLGD